jgi:hypothetical protein
MASSNKEDSSIINTTTNSSSNVIKEDSQQRQTDYHTETESTKEYETSLSEEETNSCLNNVGDKVVETVKVKFCTKKFYCLYIFFI